MYDVIIIGAGPAGCRTAELLAEEGKKVLVIEEHKKIGEPVQCTGLISANLLDIHYNLPKRIILNRIGRARFFSPNGTSFSLSPKRRVLVIDRTAFDKWLFQKAKRAGAKFKLGTKFRKFKQLKDRIVVSTSKGNFEAEVLVGADGPLSRVREQMKLEFDYHQQIFSQRIETGKFANEAQLRFVGEYFSWVVPISKTKALAGGPSKEMKFKGASGGIMRYGLLKTAHKGDIYLVGDAALQVKPFSCGGVVYGQIGADCLAQAILENRDYDELWKKELIWPIRKGLLLCQFYKLPNWAKSLLFEIITRTCSEKLLEKLDMDFY